MTRKVTEEFYKNTPWKSADEYFNFGVEHKVWGAEAKALWLKLEKQSRIPEPKVKRIKK